MQDRSTKSNNLV